MSIYIDLGVYMLGKKKKFSSSYVHVLNFDIYYVQWMHELYDETLHYPYLIKNKN